MERTVLCLSWKDEKGSYVKAEHHEILAEGLLIEVTLSAMAGIREYVTYPKNRMTHIPATVLSLCGTYRLFHFGNEIDKRTQNNELPRMGWLKRRISLLEPISIHDQTVRFYAEDGGAIIPNMPPLDIKVRTHLRRSRKYQEENPLVSDEVRLPKQLVVTFTPTEEVEE